MKAVILAAFLWACAAVPFGDREPKMFTVDVQNDNYYDATVYACLQGRRYRMGNVTGLSKAVLTYPQGTNEVHFVLDFVGTGWVATYEVMTDNLVLIIPGNAHFHSVRQVEDPCRLRPSL